MLFELLDFESVSGNELRAIARMMHNAIERANNNHASLMEQMAIDPLNAIKSAEATYSTIVYAQLVYPSYKALVAGDTLKAEERLREVYKAEKEVVLNNWYAPNSTSSMHNAGQDARRAGVCLFLRDAPSMLMYFTENS